MYTCIELFYNHPLTQCYLLESYRNFKLMLTMPKMSETRTKATSTSHHTFTSPETQLAKIWASTSTETCQEDTYTMSTYYTKTNYYNVLIQHCTVLYTIANVLKVVRCAICISYDLKAASQLKMGKGGMHNPISCNCAINPHYNFAAISNI